MKKLKKLIAPVVLLLAALLYWLLGIRPAYKRSGTRI